MIVYYHNTDQNFSFTSHRCPIHDLIFGDGVIFVVHTGSCSSCFPFYYIDFHVLNLYPHKKEINLPYDNIPQVVPKRDRFGTWNWNIPSYSVKKDFSNYFCTYSLNKRQTNIF